MYAHTCIHAQRERDTHTQTHTDTHTHTHTGVDNNFTNPFYVAYHVPVSVAGLPIGLMGLEAAWELCKAGDAQRQFGHPVTDPRVIETVRQTLKN